MRLRRMVVTKVSLMLILAAGSTIADTYPATTTQPDPPRPKRGFVVQSSETVYYDSSYKRYHWSKIYDHLRVGSVTIYVEATEYLTGVSIHLLNDTDRWLSVGDVGYDTHSGFTDNFRRMSECGPLYVEPRSSQSWNRKQTVITYPGDPVPKLRFHWIHHHMPASGPPSSGKRGSIWC